jgi:hypothetical protein
MQDTGPFAASLAWNLSIALSRISDEGYNVEEKIMLRQYPIWSSG